VTPSGKGDIKERNWKGLVKREEKTLFKESRIKIVTENTFEEGRRGSEGKTGKRNKKARRKGRIVSQKKFGEKLPLSGGVYTRSWTRGEGKEGASKRKKTMSCIPYQEGEI